jgi:hypothetical protein
MQLGGGRGQDGLAEIEGRMLVLEVVAMTSLALALGTSDQANAEIGRNVLHLIRDAVANRCIEMRLSKDVASSAQSYVDELLRAATESLFPDLN